MRENAGFQARMQDMTEMLQQRSELLEAEKQLKKKRKASLDEANAKLEHIQQLSLSMKTKAEEMRSKIKSMERLKDANHVKLHDMLFQNMTLATQVIELEQEKSETSKFYDRNKEEMEEFGRQIEETNSSLQKEVEDIQREIEMVKRTEEERKRQISEVDAEIQIEKERQETLVLKKEEVNHNIATNSKKLGKLEIALPQAIEDSRKKVQELQAAVEERKDEITHLHRENQFVEDQVYQGIMKRNQMQRELERLENTVSQSAKALHG